MPENLYRLFLQLKFTSEKELSFSMLKDKSENFQKPLEVVFWKVKNILHFAFL